MHSVSLDLSQLFFTPGYLDQVGLSMTVHCIGSVITIEIDRLITFSVISNGIRVARAEQSHITQQVMTSTRLDV